MPKVRSRFVDQSNNFDFTGEIKVPTPLSGPQAANKTYVDEAVAGGSGFQGPRGFQGNDGANGANGVQGPAGTNGTNGVQGLTGATGNAGVQGVAGTNGTNGFQGATGESGSNGVQGVQGTNGIIGVDGVQGSVGPQGVDGFQGASNGGLNGTFQIQTGGDANAGGYNTTASGFQSFAVGFQCVASGTASHAEGSSTTATTRASHAEGKNTLTGSSSGGVGAHAEGENTQALWDWSHAEGYATTAAQDSAHAEGDTSKAYGNTSHAEGYDSHALGGQSHAEGWQTYATTNYAHAEGISTISGPLYYNFTLSGTLVTITGVDATADLVGGVMIFNTNDNSRSPYYKNLADSPTFSGGDTTFNLTSTISGVTSGQLINNNHVRTGTHAEGESSRATGHVSHAEGYFTTASGEHSHSQGKYSLASLHAQDAQASGRFSTSGDAQISNLVAMAQTTNATPTDMTIKYGSSTKLTIANDTTWGFTVNIVARRTDANDESAFFELKGCIDRNATAGTTALVGTVSKTVVARDSAAWDVNATANSTDGALTITVTGEGSKTINWVARIALVEVTG